MSSPPQVPGLDDRFQILGTLGQGGMGMVYRARDLQAQREVALKLLLHSGSVPEERFRREGEIAARLQHPGIVRVFSSGVAAGRPWLAYELVGQARSLDQALGDADLRGRVELIAQAAEALEHAHAQGVVHRDIKPDNVLVDPEGRVRVTDFGLALGLESERLTKTGAMVGTPYYMAPEQIRGDKTNLSPATDVWALGVLLYEALTSQLPFQGNSLLELAAKIGEGRYSPPSGPEPLTRICRSAMRTSPGERYPSAGPMGEDLRSWLSGRAPGSAVTAGPFSRLSFWPLLAGGVGLLGMALAAAWTLRPAPPPPAAPAPPATPVVSLSTQPESTDERLAAILRLPFHSKPAALRAFLASAPQNTAGREAREALRVLSEAPLRVFAHPGADSLTYTRVLYRPPADLVTSTNQTAYRWRLGEPEPRELCSPASGLTLLRGRRAFLGAEPGACLEWTGETLAGARKHVFGPHPIRRIGADAELKFLAVSDIEGNLTFHERSPEGGYTQTFHHMIPFEVSGLLVAPHGAWVAISGGNRMDSGEGIPSGFLWVFRPTGELLWRLFLPPRPEVLSLAPGAILVGTTVGRILRFDPASREDLGQLVAPRDTSTRESEIAFRGPLAHGSTLRALEPLPANQLLSLSGGPGASGESSEVRLWQLAEDPRRGPSLHLGRLEVRGIGGISLAVDDERGIFYLASRQGQIQAWTIEAVHGLRTYNARVK